MKNITAIGLHEIEFMPYYKGITEKFSMPVGTKLEDGGMIGRNPKNYNDLFYVSPTEFGKNYIVINNATREHIDNLKSAQNEVYKQIEKLEFDEPKPELMKIQDAMKFLLKGVPIKREGWGTGTFLSLENNEIVLYTAMLAGKWDGSSKDIIAEDWIVAKEPTETMSFQEAMDKARKGLKVARHADRVVYYGNKNNIYFYEDSAEASFIMEEILATDWIVKDPK